MEVTRLILVLQILGSTWSNAEHRYSEDGFNAAAWIAQYTSSPYRPRSIQDNIYFNMTTKPEHSSEQILGIVGDGLRTTASPPSEKVIVSALLRYGQHHKYVLKTVLRGLKLLRDSDISDIRQCVREALFKANEHQPSLPLHATESTVLDHDEAKYIVKVLLTEPNYMEFCVHKTAHKNMRKQVYDSLMTEISSVIKNRQMKELVTSANAVSSTIRIDELEQTTMSIPADPVEKMEGSTTLPTIASSNVELQESSTTPNTEGPFGETDPPRTSFDFTEVNLSRKDINAALNKEILTTGFSHQITKPNQPFTPTVANKIRSKIPLIYHHGTISVAPGYNYVPRPYLSIFTVGEIDREVMAENAIPIHYPELHKAHVANEEIPSTTAEESPLRTAIHFQDNGDSTLQVTEAPSQAEPLRTVKKVLDDDEWPGPFAMERHRVVRSPTEVALDMPNMEDQGDTPDEGMLSTENSRAQKEYLLPHIPEAIPVISVPGEISDLGKEINVIKEFAEPASTVEPPIVLKVQRVPTHVDTSEFWNARKDDQESSSVYPSQGSEEANIQAFLDGLRTTESSVMRESKILKEEVVTDSLVKHSQQTVTEVFLETTTATQEKNKVPITEMLFGKDAGEASNESASNESVSSSEEDEANFDSNQKVSSEDVGGITEQDYATSHTTEESVQTVTQIATTVSEEITTTEDSTEAIVETTAETSDESTQSATSTIPEENGLYITDKPSAVSTHIAPEAETSSGAIDFVLGETTLNHAASEIIEKPIKYPVSAPTVTSMEDSKTSEGITWDPDFDFVVEEFSSSHIAKDDIPFEYTDYSLSLLGELSKSMTEFTARSTRPASIQTVNETQALSSAEVSSADGSKDSQPTSMITRPLRDGKEKENMEVLLTSLQDDAEQKEPSGLQQSTLLSRSRRELKHRELPSAALKLLKDKGLNTETMLHSRASSASGNRIPASPHTFSKSRTQKILLSLSDKRRKGYDEDAENETDSDNSVDGDASIMELIDVNRVSHILEEKV